MTVYFIQKDRAAAPSREDSRKVYTKLKVAGHKSIIWERSDGSLGEAVQKKTAIEKWWDRAIHVLGIEGQDIWRQKAGGESERESVTETVLLKGKISKMYIFISTI